MNTQSVIIVAQADPWQPYENGNKQKPVVPEPSTYGAVFLLLTILFVKARKRFTAS